MVKLEWLPHFGDLSMGTAPCIQAFSNAKKQKKTAFICTLWRPHFPSRHSCGTPETGPCCPEDFFPQWETVSEMMFKSPLLSAIISFVCRHTITIGIASSCIMDFNPRVNVTRKMLALSPWQWKGNQHTQWSGNVNVNLMYQGYRGRSRGACMSAKRQKTWRMKGGLNRVPWRQNK